MGGEDAEAGAGLASAQGPHQGLSAGSQSKSLAVETSGGFVI